MLLMLLFAYTLKRIYYFNAMATMMYLDITTTDNDNTDVQSPRLFVMHARILSELSPYTLCV